jgi:hypothetical protein
MYALFVLVLKLESIVCQAFTEPEIAIVVVTKGPGGPVAPV